MLIIGKILELLHVILYGFWHKKEVHNENYISDPSVRADNIIAAIPMVRLTRDGQKEP